jgi:uncharacterized RDD family membrane protein YckC
VDLEDAITIATPEGVQLRVVLAGAASRFIAGSIDLVIEFVLVTLAALVAFLLIGGGIGAAVFFVALLAIFLLYNILFEVLAAGRTPGKRMTHLRVVLEGGAPVDLPASATRTLMRLIDWLPSAYLVGLGSILVTRNNQRLGDIAAGTLVIREITPAGLAPVGLATASAQIPAGAPLAAPSAAHVDGATASVGAIVSADASAVTAEELAAVQRFLARRQSLDSTARRALAFRLEQGLRAKVSGLPQTGDPEEFLEALARVKSLH